VNWPGSRCRGVLQAAGLNSCAQAASGGIEDGNRSQGGSPSQDAAAADVEQKPSDENGQGLKNRQPDKREHQHDR
jgi:hypothetical protein